MYGFKKEKLHLHMLFAAAVVSLIALFFLNYTVQKSHVNKTAIAQSEEYAVLIADLLQEDFEKQPILDVLSQQQEKKVYIYMPDFVLGYSNDKDRTLGVKNEVLSKEDLSEGSVIIETKSGEEVVVPVQHNCVVEGYVGAGIDKSTEKEVLFNYIQTAVPIVLCCFVTTLVLFALCSYLLGRNELCKNEFVLILFIIGSAIVFTAYVILFAKQYLKGTDVSFPKVFGYTELTKNILAVLIFVIVLEKIYLFYKNSNPYMKEMIFCDGRSKFNRSRFIFLGFLLPFLSLSSLVCKVFPFFKAGIIHGKWWENGAAAMALIFGVCFLVGFILNRKLCRSRNILELLKGGIALFLPVFPLTFADSSISAILSCAFCGLSIGFLLDILYEFIFHIKYPDEQGVLLFQIMINFYLGCVCGICLGTLFAYEKGSFFLPATGFIGFILVFSKINSFMKPFSVKEANDEIKNPGYSLLLKKEFYGSLIYGAIGRFSKMILLMFCGMYFYTGTVPVLISILFILGLVTAQCFWGKVFKKASYTLGIEFFIFLISVTFILYSFLPYQPILFAAAFIIGLNSGAEIVFAFERTVTAAQRNKINESTAVLLLTAILGCLFLILPILQRAAQAIELSNESGIMSLCFASFGILYLFLADKEPLTENKDFFDQDISI